MQDAMHEYPELFLKCHFAVTLSLYTETASNGKLCRHDIADSPVDKPVTSAVTNSNTCSIDNSSLLLPEVRLVFYPQGSRSRQIPDTLTIHQRCATVQANLRT